MAVPGVGAGWGACSSSVASPGGRSLFAKGLAKGCTCAHLHAIFSTFGTVTDCQIARHRSGRSAGFAIVTFLRHEEAVAAMQSVDNLIFMGRRLSVKWFSPERALEGGASGIDINMQALQQALQQLQPADLVMAQLAQMLEPQVVVPQPQAQPHVSAWLDNYAFAHQPEQPAQQPNINHLLSLSALSLADPAAMQLGAVQLPGPAAAPALAATHPAAASSLEHGDGAVIVTAGTSAAAASAAAAGGKALAHSRLARWCAAPGSATTASSAPPSLADDAGSEAASDLLHPSDDSSTATTATAAASSATPLARTSMDGPVSGSSLFADTADTTTASASDPESARVSRPAVVSDPGNLYGARRVSGLGFHPTAAAAMPPPVPGAPALAPVRTSALQAPHHNLLHYHQQQQQQQFMLTPHHLAAPLTAPHARIAPQVAAPAAPATAHAAPALQQALRLQQAIAEQARNAAAQRQYADALAQLAAAREQVMAAALFNGGGLPQAMPHPAAAFHTPAGAHAVGHGVADINTLLMLQAGMSRPLF